MNINKSTKGAQLLMLIMRHFKEHDCFCYFNGRKPTFTSKIIKRLIKENVNLTEDLVSLLWSPYYAYLNAANKYNTEDERSIMASVFAISFIDMIEQYNPKLSDVKLSIAITEFKNINNFLSSLIGDNVIAEVKKCYLKHKHLYPFNGMDRLNKLTQ